MFKTVSNIIVVYFKNPSERIVNFDPAFGGTFFIRRVATYIQTKKTHLPQHISVSKIIDLGYTGAFCYAFFGEWACGWLLAGLAGWLLPCWLGVACKPLGFSGWLTGWLRGLAADPSMSLIV